jgi:RING/U-box domain-containing protein|uniref:RING-H2 finger protein n=1 Tax=Zea mays TaxID=4577 RepID=B6U4A7_MAIZE|nr:RING-H2 finger protein [Zea mays]
MGISSMPAPEDSLLGFVLYNTAASVAILAGLVRAALLFLGLAAAEDEEPRQQAEAVTVTAVGPSLADRFRSRFRPSRYGRRRGGDCRVCLVRFETESVVQRLPCGHLFHRACLETWIDYDHATCPLCRHRLLPPAAAADEVPRIA